MQWHVPTPKGRHLVAICAREQCAAPNAIKYLGNTLRTSIVAAGTCLSRVYRHNFGESADNIEDKSHRAHAEGFEFGAMVARG